MATLAESGPRDFDLRTIAAIAVFSVITDFIRGAWSRGTCVTPRWPTAGAPRCTSVRSLPAVWWRRAARSPIDRRSPVLDGGARRHTAHLRATLLATMTFNLFDAGGYAILQYRQFRWLGGGGGRMAAVVGVARRSSYWGDLYISAVVPLCSRQLRPFRGRMRMSEGGAWLTVVPYLAAASYRAQRARSIDGAAPDSARLLPSFGRHSGWPGCRPYSVIRASPTANCRCEIRQPAWLSPQCSGDRVHRGTGPGVRFHCLAG
jgi:hypothetical protein